MHDVYPQNYKMYAFLCNQYFFSFVFIYISQYFFQLCGTYPDQMARCAQLVKENVEFDFLDINCGCPIDMIYHKVSDRTFLIPSLRVTTYGVLKYFTMQHILF